MTDDEYWRQGINSLEQNFDELKQLIEMLEESKRESCRTLLNSPVGAQFLEAPASTRRSFHNAFPGGLLMHSLHVVKNALKIADAIAPGRWEKSKLIFCALFHDVGKAGTEGNPYYIQETERWKRERGEFYRVNTAQWLPAAENSVRILTQFKVPMDHDEYVAIRLNDGPYEEDNRRYAFREPPLAHIIHWADLWTTISEKECDQ